MQTLAPAWKGAPCGRPFPFRRTERGPDASLICTDGDIWSQAKLTGIKLSAAS